LFLNKWCPYISLGLSAEFTSTGAATCGAGATGLTISEPEGVAISELEGVAISLMFCGTDTLVSFTTAAFTQNH
jgi:hypothetical protein